ncbi:ER-derived vesicles protein erv29 [Microbotryomycetes sp. JL221]|nr:ER-derived vesicles protein erv29 [Microbotryomycetes sp. JL221]
MYGHPSAPALDRTGSLPSPPRRQPQQQQHHQFGQPWQAPHLSSHNEPAAAATRRSSLPASSSAYNNHDYRKSSIPAHMQQNTFGSSTPGSTGSRHNRRGSVIDVAADLLGQAAGTENMEKFRKANSKVEDLIDQYTRPVRPFLPGLGRFLIVVTFLEDALRILTQINDQNYYLQKHRGFPWGLSHLFLWSNVIVMLACSALVIAKRSTLIATGGLLSVVLAQGFGYGLIFDLNFFLRNLSVIGGLLMVLSDSLSTKKTSIPGIPTLAINETERKKYFQLAGRILLVFLFLGFTFTGQHTFTRSLVSVVGLVACVMVAIGYKAKVAAVFLVVLLNIFNFFVNNWWSIHPTHPQRDFLKYDFFQTLSIVGGLLLLVNLGPGDISFEQKKRM